MTPSAPKHLLATCLGLALAACAVAPDDASTADRTRADEDVAAAVDPGAADAAAVPTDAAPTAEPPAGDADGPRWDGVGPATFGMAADAVRAAWPGALGDGPPQDPACFHLSPVAQPDQAHFAMMFGDGRLVRYSVANDAMTAPGGGRRGMSDAEIEALYPGRVQRQPHKYTDGEYLRIAGASDSVLLFETDGAGTVTEWRVGVPPYVDYVEGCS